MQPVTSHMRCCVQSAAVLDAELTKHKAANAGIERDVARFKEREAIHKKVLCMTAWPPLGHLTTTGAIYKQDGSSVRLIDC